MSLWSTITGKKASSPTQPSASPTSSDTFQGSVPSTTFQPSFDPTTTAPDVNDFLSSASIPDPSQLHPLAGLNQQTLDYLSLEESALSDLPGARSALPSRGWSDDLCYGTGVTYLSALCVGGGWGMVEGFNRLPPGSPPKLRLNSVLNAVTRRGPFLGNSAGVIAMVYNGINSTIGYARGRHDSANSVVAGALSGMLFKSTRGLRPMMISGGLVAGAAGAWAKDSIGARRSPTGTGPTANSQKQIPTPASMNDINMVDVSTDVEKPTVDDAIRWYQEEAWRNGALGFDRDVGDLQDIFQDWNVESPPVSYVQATAGNPLDLGAAAQRLGTDAASAGMRHRERMRILDGDLILQADVRYEVHRRLQESGMHLREIYDNTEETRSLTLMTAYLWDIEHRASNFDFKMKALVCTNFRGTKRPTPIILSTKKPFVELLASLKEFVVARAEMTGRPIAAGEDLEFLNAWRYKMADRRTVKMGLIDTRWNSLAYDFHYQTMLKRYGGPGHEMMMPFLVPVNLPLNEDPATRGVVNGQRERESSPDRSLEAQQGPSGVPIAANSTEISRTETVGREESLGRVHWAGLTQRYMEGQDFLLFDD